MPPYWLAWYSKTEFDPTWKSIAPTQKDSRKLALIICGYLDLKDKSGVTCVLVRIKRRDADELIVERLCILLLTAVKVPRDDVQELMREPWKRIDGKWLAVNQIWYVD